MADRASAQPSAELGLRPPGRLGRGVDFFHRLARVRLAVPSLIFIAVVTVAAVFAPLISPHDPRVQNAFNTLQPPSSEHLLGTDHLGRDVLTRLIYGARVSLLVGVGAIAFGVLIGFPIGVLSGYVRGVTDEVLMRFMDALIAFPGLIIALGFVAVRGPSTTNIIMAIGIANMPWLARIARSQVLSIREQEYVLAAHTLGAGHLRIMARHISPNTLAPIIVQSTLGMGYAVLAEAGLSFLGVGVPPPTATWGSMLRFAFNFLNRAPWLSLIPGMAIFLLVLAFNLLGDALRDVLDPRLRGSI
jgi:peptide/nickel transport system permease protein